MDQDPRRSFGRLIYILNRFSSRYARRVLRPHRLGKEQMFYLGSLIHEGDGVTQDELAARLFVDRSSAARMLMTLEGRGLVQRQPVPGNARANQVLVTAAGRRLWSAIIPNMWRWQDVLTKGFSAAEKEQAIQLLQRMEENAAAACAEGFC